MAHINVKDHDLEQRVTLHQGDLFAPNWPKTNMISSLPIRLMWPQRKSQPSPRNPHEPVMAHLGGPDGLDITRRILAEAPKHLNKGGGLLLKSAPAVTSSNANSQAEILLAGYGRKPRRSLLAYFLSPVDSIRLS